MSDLSADRASDSHPSGSTGDPEATNGAPAKMSPQEDRLAGLITAQLSQVIAGAIEAKSPIEVDPCRSQIFELFVTAEAAGLIDEDRQSQPLSSGELTRRLGRMWGLGTAIEEVSGDQSQLSPGDLERVRRLWSLLRMWLEWSYAWKRWPEFHQAGRTVLPPPPDVPAAD